MKREGSVFLCVAAALFVSSCADLSMDNEEAVKADLPVDFKWQEYAKINNDVKMSQVIVDVREKNKEYGKGTDSTNNAVSNCVDILQDENFARKIYLEYMKCPESGWPLKEKCSGIYASYTKVSGSDTTCIIDGCWYGGWSELTVDNSWQDSLAKYTGTTGTQDKDAKNSIKAMCQFIPPKSLVDDAQKYLEDFNYNPYLIEQHYHFFGRNDGRPYKECGQGYTCEEKNQEKHAKLRGTYNDYGRYTFCLNDSEKICVVQ